MKRTVLIITIAFIAGLLVASQGLASDQYEHGMASESGGMQMEQSQQSEMAAVQLNNDQIRELQQILNDKGYDVGMIDGVIGPGTEQAIRNFQQSEGLSVTGTPDKQTLQALAPDAKTQEFFGLSPAFEEKGMEEKGMEEKGMKEQMQTPDDSKSMEKY